MCEKRLHVSLPSATPATIGPILTSFLREMHTPDPGSFRASESMAANGISLT